MTKYTTLTAQEKELLRIESLLDDLSHLDPAKIYIAVKDLKCVTWLVDGVPISENIIALTDEIFLIQDGKQHEIV